MASEIKAYDAALFSAQRFFRTIEGRMKEGPGHEFQTKVIKADIDGLADLKSQFGKETGARKLIEAAIEKDDHKYAVPFQPGVVTTDDTGGVTVAMPSSVRIGPGPGDIVALYDARPNPLQEKAALLVKFDTMLAQAASSLDKSLPNLIRLAEENIQGTRVLTKDEVDGVLAVVDGIKAANENIGNMMLYREALAKEIRAIQGGAQAPSVAKPDELLQSLLTRANELGNDFNVHSGWNPQAVIYHAVTIGKGEAKEFTDAMKASGNSVPLRKRQQVLELFYKNAGDSFAPLILNRDGAKALTDYATSLGLHLDFARVADTHKSHPMG